MNKNIKNILLHYSCAILLTIILILIIKVTTEISFLGAFYMFYILAGLLFYYDLMNFHKFVLTVVGFFLNFIIWTAEQVNLESYFHNTVLYQTKDYYFLVVFLGAFLWASNKLIIDFIFSFFKAARKDKSKFENYLLKWFGTPETLTNNNVDK
jgi:hypothetical protein